MHLLDTNAISEPLKRSPSPRFMSHLEAVRKERLFTSAITVMELRYGCARHSGGVKLWHRIQREILDRMEVVPVDSPIAERAGDLLAAVHRHGRPRSTEDLLIAATGLTHGLIVVTHNIKDFKDIPGLRVEDWM